MAIAKANARVRALFFIGVFLQENRRAASESVRPFTFLHKLRRAYGPPHHFTVSAVDVRLCVQFNAARRQCSRIDGKAPQPGPACFAAVFSGTPSCAVRIDYSGLVAIESAKGR